MPGTDDSTVDVRFDGNDATIGGALAAADGARPPGLVLIPDVHGLSDLYRRIATDLARAGFTTLVLDPYCREGTPTLGDFAAVTAWIADLDDRRVLSDVTAAHRHLSRLPEVDPNRTGVLGFCLGGQYTVLSACRVAGFRAAVSFYGMLRYSEYPAHKPESPLDAAPDLACPLLGLYGEDDPLIPGTDVDELCRITADHDKAFRAERFRGAGHAFLNDARPEAFRPEAAARAWDLAIDFFRRHLGA